MVSLFHDNGLEHRELQVRRGVRTDVTFAIAIHSDGAQGRALGGCRMIAYDRGDEAVTDALRLSRAMTWKAASVGLSHGGAKCAIWAPREPISAEFRRNIMFDVGDAVERLDGRFLTGKDFGTTTDDFIAMSQRTRNVIGLPPEHGGSGDPSVITADGVIYAMEAGCEAVFGQPSLAGRTVAVLGLGAVGSHVARGAAARGAQLFVGDVDTSRQDLAAELGAEWVAPNELPLQAVDVLSPCALGGLLTARLVPELRCRLIAGAANNQLASDEVAGALRDHGILWAPDFVANAGGLIGVASEVDGYDLDEARARTAAIGSSLRDIFSRAEETGDTTLKAALAYAKKRSAEILAN